MQLFQLLLHLIYLKSSDYYFRFYWDIDEQIADRTWCRNQSTQFTKRFVILFIWALHQYAVFDTGTSMSESLFLFLYIFNIHFYTLSGQNLKLKCWKFECQFLLSWLCSCACTSFFSKYQWYDTYGINTLVQSSRINNKRNGASLCCLFTY